MPASFSTYRHDFLAFSFVPLCSVCAILPCSSECFSPLFKYVSVHFHPRFFVRLLCLSWFSSYPSVSAVRLSLPSNFWRRNLSRVPLPIRRPLSAVFFPVVFRSLHHPSFLLWSHRLFSLLFQAALLPSPLPGFLHSLTSIASTFAQLATCSTPRARSSGLSANCCAVESGCFCGCSLSISFD